MDIIPVLKTFITEVFTAAANFMETPTGMAELEQRLTCAGRNANARILAQILEEYDSLLRELPTVKEQYIVSRRRDRTLVTTFGDVTFKRTQFLDRQTHSRCCLLDEKVHLPKCEHLSALAEVEVLKEATKSSYQRAADRLKVGDQTISKVTVMNKVHAVLEELPMEQRDVKKACEYLYIEADEDHVARQRPSALDRGCIIAKLVYVYEGKEDVCKGRRRLVCPVYMGGRYAGPKQNTRLWERVEEYLQKNYDTDVLKAVYILGDGGGWIKAGTDHISKSIFVIDKFHLSKYINAAANQMLDDAAYVKGRFYKYIYKGKKHKARKLLKRMRRSVANPKSIDELESFLMNNWEAAQRAYRDRHVYGCSAEGHVSHLYSDRMSSRPMGWSNTGADRMCRLRCLVQTQGESKIIDLVEARRERMLDQRFATGTDGIKIDIPAVIRKFSQSQREAAARAERMHAGFTSALIRKKLAIKLHIRDL